jgi:hypothetical protein
MTGPELRVEGSAWVVVRVGETGQEWPGYGRGAGWRARSGLGVGGVWAGEGFGGSLGE